jgi:hypothetical protein
MILAVPCWCFNPSLPLISYQFHKLTPRYFLGALPLTSGALDNSTDSIGPTISSYKWHRVLQFTANESDGPGTKITIVYPNWNHFKPEGTPHLYNTLKVEDVELFFASEHELNNRSSTLEFRHTSHPGNCPLPSLSTS